MYVQSIRGNVIRHAFARSLNIHPHRITRANPVENDIWEEEGEKKEGKEEKEEKKGVEEHPALITSPPSIPPPPIPAIPLTIMYPIPVYPMFPYVFMSGVGWRG